MYTHIHTDVEALISMCTVHVYKNMHASKHIHTYIYTYTHTYIHTYIHTDVEALASMYTAHVYKTGSRQGREGYHGAEMENLSAI